MEFSVHAANSPATTASFMPAELVLAPSSLSGESVVPPSVVLVGSGADHPITLSAESLPWSNSPLPSVAPEDSQNLSPEDPTQSAETDADTKAAAAELAVRAAIDKPAAPAPGAGGPRNPIDTPPPTARDGSDPEGRDGDDRPSKPEDDWTAVTIRESLGVTFMSRTDGDPEMQARIRAVVAGQSVPTDGTMTARDIDTTARDGSDPEGRDGDDRPSILERIMAAERSTSQGQEVATPTETYRATLPRVFLSNPHTIEPLSDGAYHQFRVTTVHDKRENDWTAAITTTRDRLEVTFTPRAGGDPETHLYRRDPEMQVITREAVAGPPVPTDGTMTARDTARAVSMREQALEVQRAADQAAGVPPHVVDASEMRFINELVAASETPPTSFESLLDFARNREGGDGPERIPRTVDSQIAVERFNDTVHHFLRTHAVAGVEAQAGGYTLVSYDTPEGNAVTTHVRLGQRPEVEIVEAYPGIRSADKKRFEGSGIRTDDDDSLLTITTTRLTFTLDPDGRLVVNRTVLGTQTDSSKGRVQRVWAAPTRPGDDGDVQLLSLFLADKRRHPTF